MKFCHQKNIEQYPSKYDQYTIYNMKKSNTSKNILTICYNRELKKNIWKGYQYRVVKNAFYWRKRKEN